jgi:hypothetical protein
MSTGTITATLCTAALKWVRSLLLPRHPLRTVHSVAKPFAKCNGHPADVRPRIAHCRRDRQAARNCESCVDHPRPLQAEEETFAER